jgi:hypothetical protein
VALRHVHTNYQAFQIRGRPWPIGRAGVSWFPGQTDNNVNELAKVKFRYHDENGDDLLSDPRDI